MSMSTRSELEEERRLFYVALTRAEHQPIWLMHKLPLETNW
jgi:ATP-dependent exoDNAse (exonuclease V) beta subunit